MKAEDPVTSDSLNGVVTQYARQYGLVFCGTTYIAGREIYELRFISAADTTKEGLISMSNTTVRLTGDNGLLATLKQEIASLAERLA